MKTTPPILGLFQKRVEGDDALLHLANHYFKEIGMGAEIYSGNTDDTDYTLRFRPEPSAFSVLHLRRGWNLFVQDDERELIETIKRYDSFFSGFVVHDQHEIKNRMEEYVRIMKRVSQALPSNRLVFIEYAGCLDPETYLTLARKLDFLHNISLCLDVGHIALWEIARVFESRNKGENIFTLKGQNHLPESTIEEIQFTVQTGLPAVLNVIEGIGSTHKRVHFHLHDGHPLSATSPFGLSDHLSFFQTIESPSLNQKKKNLKTIFGKSGATKIARSAIESIGATNVSFTLEIHDIDKQRPLDPSIRFFDHWTDFTHAEKMNYWLWDLQRNYEVIQKEIDRMAKKMFIPTQVA